MLDVRSECVNGNWPEFQAFRTKEGADRLSPNAESWMAFSGRSLCERATGYTLFHIHEMGVSRTSTKFSTNQRIHFIPKRGNGCMMNWSSRNIVYHFTFIAF